MLISFCLYFHFTINYIGWYYYIFGYEHPCNKSKDNKHGDSNVFCMSKLKTASYSIHQPLPLFPCLIVLTITAHQLSVIGRMRKTSSRTMNPVLLDLLLQKSARATMRLVLYMPDTFLFKSVFSNCKLLPILWQSNQFSGLQPVPF